MIFCFLTNNPIHILFTRRTQIGQTIGGSIGSVHVLIALGTISQTSSAAGNSVVAHRLAVSLHPLLDLFGSRQHTRHSIRVLQYNVEHTGNVLRLRRELLPQLDVGRLRGVRLALLLDGQAGAQQGQYYDADYKVVDDDENNKK